MSARAYSADIVITGLGPVGAVAANLAGQAGFETLVIERETNPFALPRAIVFDAEIMRVFASIGLADEISAVTRPLGGSVYVGADRKPIRTFRSPGPAHPLAFPPTNLFYQPTLEQTIRDGLKRFPNVKVLSGVEVSDITVRPDGARLVANDGGQRIEIAARHVLACDGASSTVRKRLGVGLDDIGFEERWLVIDAFVHGPMRWPQGYDIPDEVRDGRFSLMVCEPGQPATLIPGVGQHRRWEYMLMPGESDADAVRPERILERLSKWIDPAHAEIVRAAVYRFRALVAHRWREGPVYLMGDAAHQTPPFFGQGMCHGIRDAAQLMWRLALTERGAAGEGLLDSYQAEREPHVREIITASVAAGAAVCITDPERARERDAEFRAIEAARTTTVAMSDVVPPIRQGLIDAETGGARLAEFAVEDAGAPVRLDALLGGRFAVITAGGCPQPALAGEAARRWAAIGGPAIDLAAPGAEAERIDVDGRFAGWLAERGACAALVRPDRYVYGLARSPQHLAQLIGGLVDALGAPASAALRVETVLP